MAGNPNITVGQLLPGVWGYIDYNTQGGGQDANKRCLIWAYQSSVAQRAPNTPFLPASQQEVDDGCGRGSDAANDYAAAIAQPESQGAEVWIMPIAEVSGNVASTYSLTVLLSGSNPSKAGTLSLWLDSMPVPAVGFDTTDTAATIAANLTAALNTMLDSPIGTCTVLSNVITVPYKHKGTTGEDFPIRCNISPAATGVTLAAGQATFANNAVGAGSVVVTSGALSVSTPILNGDVPSGGGGIAAKVAASWNASGYPLTASAVGAVVNFLFANDKDVHRMSAAIVTSTGTTVNLGSGATDGTGSVTSLSYNGTQGVGAPALTAALAGLASGDAYRSWSAPWTDAVTVGALATALETQSDGSITGQKQQHLTLASSLGASTAGAIATGSSPNLTATAPHYAIAWAPDAAVKGSKIAVRIAAARAAIWADTPQHNYNGFQLKGSQRSPLLLPWTKPSVALQNTALRTYALAPVVTGRSGLMEVVKGRTTSLANDHRLWAWSAEAQAAFHFLDLTNRFASKFSGGSIVRFSTPKAPGLFDALSFASETVAAMHDWEKAGHYDGADLLASAVKAVVDGNNINKIDVDFPESPVVDLDQVSFVGHFTSPGA